MMSIYATRVCQLFIALGIGNALSFCAQSMYGAFAHSVTFSHVIIQSPITQMYIVEKEESRLVLYVRTEKQDAYKITFSKGARPDYEKIPKQVSLISAPCQIIERTQDKKTISEYFTGAYRGAKITVFPYVEHAGKYKVQMWNGVKDINRFLYEHTNPVRFVQNIALYNFYEQELAKEQELQEIKKSLLDDQKEFVTVLVSASTFPSLSIWAQRVMYEKNTGGYTVKSEIIKRWPGYVPLAIGDNRILYVKDPSKRNIFYRYFYPVDAHKLPLYVQKIINNDGSFADLAEGKEIASAVPLSLKEVVQGAVTRSCAAWIDNSNTMWIHTDLEGAAYAVKEAYEPGEQRTTQPFIVTHKGARYVLWFSSHGSAYYVAVDEEFNKKNNLYTVHQWELPLADKVAYVYTYYPQENSFYYVYDKTESHTVDTLGVDFVTVKEIVTQKKFVKEDI